MTNSDNNRIDFYEQQTTRGVSMSITDMVLNQYKNDDRGLIFMHGLDSMRVTQNNKLRHNEIHPYDIKNGMRVTISGNMYDVVGRQDFIGEETINVIRCKKESDSGLDLIIVEGDDVVLVCMDMHLEWEMTKTHEPLIEHIHVGKPYLPQYEIEQPECDELEIGGM